MAFVVVAGELLFDFLDILVPPVGIRYVSYESVVIKFCEKWHSVRWHAHEMELQTHGVRFARELYLFGLGEDLAWARMPLPIGLDLKEAVVSTCE